MEIEAEAATRPRRQRVAGGLHQRAGGVSGNDAGDSGGAVASGSGRSADVPPPAAWRTPPPPPSPPPPPGPRWSALSLRFDDAGLEGRFWASPPVRGALLRVDALAVWAVLLNNAVIGLMYFQTAARNPEGGAANALLWHHTVWAVPCISAQILAHWCGGRGRRRHAAPRSADAALCLLPDCRS